uniref:Uncharacterized protein n=1 Tax=Amazona collaria TaxID=241587 RepID=A0A8B9ITF7_9PSIT
PGHVHRPHHRGDRGGNGAGNGSGSSRGSIGIPCPWSLSRASSSPTSASGASSPARPTSWGLGSRPRWSHGGSPPP